MMVLKIITSSNISEFTYGTGLNIPVRKMPSGKISLDIKSDFVSLKQPALTNSNTDKKNFMYLHLS